jgi:hypothetical protein
MTEDAIAGLICGVCVCAGEIPNVERDAETTTIMVGAGKTSHSTRGLTFQVGPLSPFVLHVHAEGGAAYRALTAPIPTEAAARDLTTAAIAWARGGEPIEAMAAIWDRVFPPDPPDVIRSPPAKVTCFWDWCEACGATVRCGVCGNKCCNGGHGTLADGSACLSCADAYAMQDKRDMPDELRARDAILNMSRIASEQRDREEKS